MKKKKYIPSSSVPYLYTAHSSVSFKISVELYVRPGRIDGNRQIHPDVHRRYRLSSFQFISGTSSLVDLLLHPRAISTLSLVYFHMYTHPIKVHYISIYSHSGNNLSFLPTYLGTRATAHSIHPSFHLNLSQYTLLHGYP